MNRLNFKMKVLTCAALILIISNLFTLEISIAQDKKESNTGTQKKLRNESDEVRSPVETDSLSNICNGIQDNFVCPSEPTVRDPDIVNMITGRQDSADCFDFLDFDVIPWRSGCTVNTPVGYFVHKMVFQTGISAATLTFKARAASKNETSSDYIFFVQGTTVVAGSMLKDLPAAGGTWNHDQVATFTLNLASLPPSFKTASIITHLQDGDIDVVIGSGTGVDYMCIAVDTSPRFDINLINQGYYLHNVGLLIVRDIFRASLHSASSPYNLIDSASAYVDSITFAGAFGFQSAANGNYYLVINHKNTLETWSYTPVSFNSGGSNFFNFTTASSQAFGSNMIQVSTSPVLFAFFSGDVNQDETIDLTDIILIYNDAVNFVSGVVVTDINGDQFVDLSDLLFAYNNSSNFVTVIKP